MSVYSAHLCGSNSYPLRHLDSDQKGRCLKSGRFGALKPGKLGLSHKAIKYSGVLTTLEALSMEIYWRYRLNSPRVNAAT